jgi:hypothetical protein
MKMLLATVAVVAAVASPALAQSPNRYTPAHKSYTSARAHALPYSARAHSFRGYASPYRARTSRAYVSPYRTRASRAYAPYRGYASPYRGYASPYGAYASPYRPYSPSGGYYFSPPRAHSPNPAWDVYDTRGWYVGSDPDPRVRDQLARDPSQGS